jgi:hypothetical protein
VLPDGGHLAYVSATQLSFLPFKGSSLKINGLTYQIPTSGVVGLANTGIYIDGVAGQNLAINTNYYVYCFNNAGVLTADFSVTGHATSSTAGNVGTEIKSGDDTRTLIGLVRTGTGAVFADSQTTRFVRSWQNRGRLSFSVIATGSISQTALTQTGANINLVCFGDDALVASGVCFGTGSAVGNFALVMCLDGVGMGQTVATTTSTTAKNEPTACCGAWNPSEGQHNVGLYSQMSGGAFSGNWYLNGLLG